MAVALRLHVVAVNSRLGPLGLAVASAGHALVVPVVL